MIVVLKRLKNVKVSVSLCTWARYPSLTRIRCFIICELNLGFSVPDLPVVSVSHSNLTVVEGDEVTVICNGSALPIPEVDWAVNGLRSITTQQVYAACSQQRVHSLQRGKLFHIPQIFLVSPLGKDWEICDFRHRNTSTVRQSQKPNKKKYRKSKITLYTF